GLATATVNAGVCAVAAPALAPALAPDVAGFSQQVIALAEGALRTMWMTKIKMVLIGVLAASMVCASLGGLVWHQGARVQAQAPDAVTPPPAKADQGQDVAALERQLEALQAQVQEKQRQLARLRTGDALDQIEADLK